MRRPADLIDDALHAGQVRRLHVARGKRTPPAEIGNEPWREIKELRRIVLVDEKDVHCATSMRKHGTPDRSMPAVWDSAYSAIWLLFHIRALVNSVGCVLLGSTIRSF